MDKAELKSFRKPDEVRDFPRVVWNLSRSGARPSDERSLNPAGDWAASVQLAKTKSCEAPHFQYHVSGALRVRMDDGSEFDCKEVDVSSLPSGHDAWVVGDEPAVVMDFQGIIDYAKSA